MSAAYLHNFQISSYIRKRKKRAELFEAVDFFLKSRGIFFPASSSVRTDSSEETSIEKYNNEINQDLRNFK